MKVRRTIAVKINGFDGNFQDPAAASCKSHQHVHFIFVTITLDREKIGNQIGGKSTKSSLCIIKINSAAESKDGAGKCTSQAASKRNFSIETAASEDQCARHFFSLGKNTGYVFWKMLSIGVHGHIRALAEDILRRTEAENRIGDVRSFGSNFLVVVKALAYMMFIGREGMAETASNAVLNANYMMNRLKDLYPMAYDAACMHEFVMSLEQMKHDTGVSALDIAKALVDYGMHPPTMYFPLIVHEALMVEPTETETVETLDEAVEVFRKIMDEARANPEQMHERPRTTRVCRPDEVRAARKPVIRYDFDA